MNELELKGLKNLIQEIIDEKLETIQNQIDELEDRLNTDENQEEDNPEDEEQLPIYPKNKKFDSKRLEKSRLEEDEEEEEDEPELEEEDEEDTDEDATADQEAIEMDKKVLKKYKEALEKAHKMKGNQITSKKEIDLLNKGHIKPSNLLKKKQQPIDQGFDEDENQEDELSEYEEQNK